MWFVSDKEDEIRQRRFVLPVEKLVSGKLHVPNEAALNHNPGPCVFEHMKAVG